MIVDAKDHYIKLGEFIDIEIFDAGDFDLYGKPLVQQEKFVPLNQRNK